MIMIVAFGTSTPTSITVVATRTSSSRALNWAISSRRLTAVVQVLAEPLVGLTRSVLGDPGGLDRLAVGGRLRDLAHLEVAVDRQRERPRDRRRGHVQH